MKVVTPLRREVPVVPEIHKALRAGVDEGVFPGGAAAVFLGGKIVHLSATGDAQVVPEPVSLKSDAVFDLASLTKVLATTAAAAMVVGRRLAGLDEPVWRFLPEFGRGGKKAVTLRHLLAHASGLPAWRPLFLEVLADPGGKPLFGERPNYRERLAGSRRGRSLVFEAVCNMRLERPPGTEAVYSDLGFVVLGRVLESLFKTSLDRLVVKELYSELGLPSLAFRPFDEKPRRAPQLVATGVRRPREPAPGQEKLVPAPDPALPPSVRLGEVDDDNAFAMGGVAGHAGLFGNARDVAAFGALVLEELGGASRLASPQAWEEFCRRDATPGSSRALGFDTPAGDAPAAGAKMAASRTFGHTGFTGTSLWVDRERQLSVALLTNRVHPSRANLAITAFRPRFHDAVVEALEL